MDIKLNEPKSNTENVKRNKSKKPMTMEEAWENIKTRKNSEADLKKLREVYISISDGEIEIGCPISKFSKAHALRLYDSVISSRKNKYIRDVVTNMPNNYMLINNITDFNFLLQDLLKEKEIGLDTETDGLEHNNRIVGISMTLPIADRHVYIPIRHTIPNVIQLDATFVLEALKPYLEDENLGKILHNAKFDSHMFYKEGIDLKGIVMDTMIAMHVLNENELSYALKTISTKYGKYFGFEDKSWKYEELFGKCGFENTPLDIGTYYACKDTHLTVKLAEWIRSFMNKGNNLGDAYELENKVLDVVIKMERRGMLLDKEFAEEYSKNLSMQIEELRKEVVDLLGIDNINSNQQLLAFIKDNIDKKAKSVDKKYLKSIKHKNKAIDKLLEYRKLSKIYTTYIEPIPKMVLPDGRIHPRFNQRGTVTCRFSSNSPNFQNLPYEAREMFIAPKGKMLVGIDFS